MYGLVIGLHSNNYQLTGVRVPQKYAQNVSRRCHRTNPGRWEEATTIKTDFRKFPHPRKVNQNLHPPKHQSDSKAKYCQPSEPDVRLIQWGFRWIRRYTWKFGYVGYWGIYFPELLTCLRCLINLLTWRWTMINQYFIKFFPYHL